MNTLVPGWTTLAEQPAVLVKDYAFGAGRANSLAVELPEKQWLLMSPPKGLSAAEVDAFAALGHVVALVENNGAHHLGLGSATAHFPDAVTYATPLAAGRIRKKGKSYGALEPIEKLRPKLGEAITLTEIEGTKIGDVVMHVRTERGTAFYASDFIANIEALPKNPLFRLMFKLTDSAPGLKVFGVYFRFYVADAALARAHLVRELRAHAPTILVPAHGEVCVRDDLTQLLVGMLEKR